MKKILWFTVAMLLVTAMVFTLAACGPKDDPDDKKDPPDGTFVESDPISAAALKGIAAGKQVYVSSIGQDSFSNGVNVVKTASGLTAGEAGEQGKFVSDNLLEASEVTDGSVVFLVVSGSAKGLGGSNEYTKESEEIRATAFATAASQDKFTLIVLHLGGTARRGTLTDGFLDIVCPEAAAVVVRCSEADNANSDGYFTKYDAYYYSTLSKVSTGIAPLFTAA